MRTPEQMLDGFIDRLFQAMKSGEIPIKYGRGYDDFRRHITDAFKSFIEAERRESERLKEDLRKEIETIKPLLDELLKCTSPLPQEPTRRRVSNGNTRH